MTDRRGVSTVLDVTLCLVFVSAAVLTLSVFLESDAAAHDPDVADETAELLGATTISMEYSTQPVTRDDEFDADAVDGDRAFERSKHGTAADLLASAAVANAEIDGTHLSRAGGAYESALEGAILDQLTDVDENVRIEAVWQPHDDSSIRGTATVGQEPPDDADVSTATIDVPTGHPAPDEGEAKRAYAGGYDGLSMLVASAILEGFFPPERTQLALERQGFEREMAEYRYDRAIIALDEVEHYDLEPSIDRTSADTAGANAVLAEALASEYVSEELGEAIESERDAKANDPAFDGADGDSRAHSDGELVGSATTEVLTADRTTIVVQTWT